MIEAKYQFKREGMGRCELEYHAELSKPHWCIYWDARQYCLGRELAIHGFYPRWLPICANVMHGLCFRDDVPSYLFEIKAPHTFILSSYMNRRWKARTTEKGSQMVSPFVMYRTRLKIVPAPSALGTLVFVSHSTANIAIHEDVDQFVKMLRNLPSEWGPVSICIHFADINKGLHLRYLKEGFPVYTAGNGEHPFFVDNFYEILKNFKRTLSTSVGSFSFYSEELGIPFVRMGATPKYEVFNDHHLPLGILDPSEAYERLKGMERIFVSANESLCASKLSVIRDELGLSLSLTRLVTGMHLYKSLFVTIWRRIMQRF
jgi:hypothetical protein